jgi:3-polyprenyl-4-hydroxybenzoate decarboxylase
LEDEIRLNDSLNGIRFWIFLDEWADLNDPRQVTWLTGSNVEALHDIRIFPAPAGKESGMMFIDATVKSYELDGFQRPWPNPTLMDKETIKMVDHKWAGYDAGPEIPSRSSRHARFYLPGAVRKAGKK